MNAPEKLATLSSPVRVLLADTSGDVLAAQRWLLFMHPSLHVVGTCQSAGDAEKACADFDPDLLLIDSNMAKLCGADALQAIKRSRPSLQIVVTSSEFSADCQQRALAAGADDYVEKSKLLDALPHLLAIRAQADTNTPVPGTGTHSHASAPDIATLTRTHMQRRRRPAMIQALPQAVILIDEDGRALDINPAAAALLGVPSTEHYLGRGLLHRVAPEYRQQACALHSGALHGISSHTELELVDATGDRFWVECTAAPLKIETNSRPEVLVVAQEIAGRKQIEDRLHFLANHDPLTQLPNRTLFMDRLRQAMVDASRHDRLNGIAFLDIDCFSKVNDTIGQKNGDVLLSEVALRLTAALRPGDTVARFGGDEFAILISDMAKAEDAALVVQHIFGAFREPFTVDEHELTLTVDIGVTLYPLDDPRADADTLLRNADTALLRAKQAGRSNCQFYTTEMTAQVAADMAMESALRHAIERDELHLVYQPIIDRRSGKARAVEALLRWISPEHGAVSPSQFIPFAEESGLIVPIGDWVLRTACLQTRQWQDAGLKDICVAVNVSTRQFREPDFVQRVELALAAAGLQGHFLELEITESVLLGDIQATINLMQQLDKLGVRIAIDDFGTGYSSLNYLKKLPINVLKIDQSFVRDVVTRNEDAAIVRAIITLAHSLGLQVVAEGIENDDQLQFLTANGAESLQGFLFSKPKTAHEMSLLLTVHAAAWPPFDSA